MLLLLSTDVFFQKKTLLGTLRECQTVWIQSDMRGSRNFRQGGGGVQFSLTKSSDNAFFSPQLILQKSNGQFQRNLSFFKVPEGVKLFPWLGGPTIARGGGGGSSCLFPIETHITCDFPGGGGFGPPAPPPPPPSGPALAGPICQHKTQVIAINLVGNQVMSIFVNVYQVYIHDNFYFVCL